MKILIADDSPVIRNSLRKLISTFNGSSTIFESGSVQDTIKKIAEVKPDILILDIMMPGGNGFDVMSCVRESENKITVIVLTNFATEPNRKKSIEEKVDYFLDKSTEFLKIVDICNGLKLSTVTV
jgi:DNA-binding NarL/FixJ family response regulator